MTSAPLGRAAQPFGWPERLGAVTTGPLSKSPATDYVGARAAQPFGWPEQVIAQEQAATTSALRKAAAAQ